MRSGTSVIGLLMPQSVFVEGGGVLQHEVNVCALTLMMSQATLTPCFHDIEEGCGPKNDTFKSKQVTEHESE